ncbi:MerR family transcriptional regulator, partial [Rhodopseudomonas sp. B29]|uniref:MerR family transcriptional regulator n=1 Tax=Rhodopseudomonas sp. B29 TaxID=95607 RepID=UPI0003B2ED04
PQHVLRFWETRFTQIKPMKRSGGRRYYRPDDVDLLKGIRRLLYGEGYTIRGVQRILKEHGIKSVQRLADADAVASFGAVEAAISRTVTEDDDYAPVHGIDLDDDDYEGEDEGLDLHAALGEPDRAAPAPPPSTRGSGNFEARRAPSFDQPAPKRPAFEEEDEDEIGLSAPHGAADDEDDDFNLPPLDFSSSAPATPPVDLAPLRAVLSELLAARALLDAAMKDG